MPHLHAGSKTGHFTFFTPDRHSKTGHFTFLPEIVVRCDEAIFLAHHAPRPAAAPVLPLRAAAVLPRRLAGTPEGKRRQPCALAPCTGLCARSAPCATCADSKNCLQARLTSCTITADKRHILKTIYVPLAPWAGDSDIAYVHLGGSSLCYASYFSYEEGAGAQRFSLTMDASRITDELFLTSSELEVVRKRAHHCARYCV